MFVSWLSIVWLICWLISIVLIIWLCGLICWFVIIDNGSDSLVLMNWLVCVLNIFCVMSWYVRIMFGMVVRMIVVSMKCCMCCCIVLFMCVVGFV